MKQIQTVLKKLNNLKLVFIRFGLFLIIISLISCDGYSGMDGIVKDSETGKVLEGVKVEMTSHYKTINTTTNASGEFFTFHTEKVKQETARYAKIPEILDFRDKDGNDIMSEQIQLNYERIKREVLQIVSDEKTRILDDPDLKHLIKDEKR